MLYHSAPLSFLHLHHTFICRSGNGSCSVSHSIIFPHTDLFTNVHCKESLFLFKASGYSISTGPRLLSDILLLTRVMEILCLWFHRTGLLYWLVPHHQVSSSTSFHSIGTACSSSLFLPSLDCMFLSLPSFSHTFVHHGAATSLHLGAGNSLFVCVCSCMFGVIFCSLKSILKEERYTQHVILEQQKRNSGQTQWLSFSWVTWFFVHTFFWSKQ